MTRRQHIDTSTKTLPCTDCQKPTKCAGDALGVTCSACVQKRVAKFERVSRDLKRSHHAPKVSFVRHVAKRGGDAE